MMGLSVSFLRYEQSHKMADEAESESNIHLKEVRDLPDVVGE